MEEGGNNEGAQGTASHIAIYLQDQRLDRRNYHWQLRLSTRGIF